jgi:glycosyltransferase involved in cell wall biosynthesis
MDFLSFSHDYWDSPRQNRQNFCEALAARHKVLFCGPPFYIVTLLRQLGRGTLSPSGVRRIKPNLVSYTPSKLLFKNHRFRTVNDWLQGLRYARIRQLMRRERFQTPVVLVWNPDLAEVADRFADAVLVYYIYDQYSGYTGGNSNQPDPREVELIRRADVVFVVSEELQRDKSRWSDNVHHLPNAVDFELFSQSRDPRTIVPADMASITGPRLGYIGTINEKLNVALLEHIARTRPEWSIVLIGRQNYTLAAERQQFEALIERPNVHWLGHRDHTLLPAYLKGLDICMMCYNITSWTYFGDPLKMHEYLASGKPTIAAGLKSIEPFADVIAIPPTHEARVQAIEDGLHRDTEARRQQRIDTARRNSYDARVEAATAIIAGAVARRHRAS